MGGSGAMAAAKAGSGRLTAFRVFPSCSAAPRNKSGRYQMPLRLGCRSAVRGVFVASGFLGAACAAEDEFWAAATTDTMHNDAATEATTAIDLANVLFISPLLLVSELVGVAVGISDLQKPCERFPLDFGRPD